MDKIVVIGGDLSLTKMTDGDCRLTNVIDGEHGEVIAIDSHETYVGETHITPAQNQQILNTEDKILIDNIIIDPIPSNYGKITWNGSILTVS